MQPHSSPDQPTLPSMPMNVQGAPGIQQRAGNLWQRYRGATRPIQVLLAVGAALVLMVCSCCSCGAIATALQGNTTAAINTPSTSSGGQATRQSNGTTTATTAISTATQPAFTPTPKSTATATPKPKPPTATPKPSCTYSAVNGNPWCYTFTNTGKHIYNPPGDFCGYFNCISSFWNGTGYVVECQDATYSKSGGHTGSCSRHGGDLRTLYAQ